MAYVKKLKIGTKTYDIVDSRIITIVDSGSTTAGTWKASTEAPAGNITAYKDGQLFLYKIVVAGAATTTLNIDGLGAKTIYRVGTTKLSTQYGVGQYLLLVYNSTNDCFRVVNDYDANSDTDKKTSSSDTSSKIFLVGATTQSSDGQTTYSHDTVYVDANGRVNSRINGGDTVATVVTTGDTTETVVKSINGGSGSFTPTTKYLHKSTASVAPNSHTHSVTVSGNTGNNSGNAVKAVTGYANFSGGSGSASLSVYSSDTTTTADTAASSGRIPYISAASHTAASLGTASTGTVSISGGAYTGTTKYMKVSTVAADTGTVGISGGSGNLTIDTTATNGIGVLTARGTFSQGTLPSLTITSKAPSKITSWSDGAMTHAVVTNGVLIINEGTKPSLSYEEVSVGSASGWSAGSLPTLGDATTKYLHHTHTAASLTGTKTFATNGIKSVTLSASSTSTDGPAYTESISGSAPSLGGTKTFVTGYPNFSGGSGSHTTKYLKLNHTHTGASLGTPSTGDAAPHTHTHSYGSSTALTTGNNSGTAVTAVTDLTVNTTAATGDITYLESATHSHTGASVSNTATVYKK